MKCFQIQQCQPNQCCVFPQRKQAKSKQKQTKTHNNKQKHTITNKNKRKQTKTNQNKQKQTKTNKNKQKQTKTNKNKNKQTNDILCQPSDAVHHHPPADEPLATSQKQTNILRTKIYRMSFVIHIFQLANLAQHELFLYSHYLSFAFKPSTNKKLSLSPLFKYFFVDDFMDMLLLLKASFIPVRRVLKEVSKQEAKGKRLPCRVQILGVSIFFVLCMFWYGAGRNR